MPTLILSPRQSPDSITLWRTAIRLGWEVERLANWRVPPDLDPDDPLIYGEPLFAASVAERLGTTLIGPTSQWLASLPPEYLRRDLRLTSLRSARESPQAAFIKTAEGGLKCFPAGVFEPHQVIPGGELLSPDLEVLVGEPVRWEVEFRAFVSDRQVRTLSVYLRMGELAAGDPPLEDWYSAPEERDEALGFYRYLLSDPNVPLPPACVLDVGRIAGRGWAVVEANDAYGSGLCGCDPEPALGVIRLACIKEPTEEQRRWKR